MIRFGYSLLACAVIALNPAPVPAADTPEVKNLKKEIELLKKENDLLQKEIELLKAGPVKGAPKDKDGDKKGTMWDIDFELLSAKVDQDVWKLEMNVTSNKTDPFDIAFKSVVCYTEDGTMFKVASIPRVGSVRQLNTSQKTKIKLDIGTIPAKYTSFERVELYFNSGPRQRPITFKNVKIER